MDLHHEHLLCCGTAAVEEILRTAFRVDIHKALNPLNDRDFVLIVAQLSRAMSRAMVTRISSPPART